MESEIKVILDAISKIETPLKIIIGVYRPNDFNHVHNHPNDLFKFEIKTKPCLSMLRFLINELKCLHDTYAKSSSRSSLHHFLSDLIFCTIHNIQNDITVNEMTSVLEELVVSSICSFRNNRLPIKNKLSVLQLISIFLRGSCF